MKSASDRTTTNAIKPFEPLDDGNLLSEDELDAEVSAGDIDAAIAAWRKNPPDRIFLELLEAESDG